LIRTVLDARRLPPSAIAFLRVHPPEAKLLRRLRTLLLVTVSNQSAAIPAVVALPIFVPHLLGVIMTWFAALWAPIFAALALVVLLDAKAKRSEVLQRAGSSRYSSSGSSKYSASSKRQTDSSEAPPTIASLRKGYNPRPSAATSKNERGVSLAFLLQFVRENDVHEDEMTWQVCDRVVRVHTAAHCCCYFDMLAGGCDADGVPWAAAQTVFISHSWGKSFMHLVRTAMHFEEAHGNGHHYYIDLFGLNQHDLAEVGGTLPASRSRTPSDVAANSAATLTLGASSFDVTTSCTANQATKDAIAAVLLDTLDRSIQTAEFVLVAVDSWQDPAPLGRIWCLYEIWRSMVLGKTVSMGFPREAAVAFVEAVRALEVDVDQLVEEKADMRKAQATVQDDLCMIQGRVEETIGMDAFNAEIREKLMAHLVHSSMHTSGEPCRSARQPMHRPRKVARAVLIVARAVLI